MSALKWRQKIKVPVLEITHVWPHLCATHQPQDPRGRWSSLQGVLEHIRCR